MAINQWDETALPKRPGLYVNFKKAAQAIVGGSRGTVALPIFVYDGTLEEGEFAYVETEGDAVELLGADNAEVAVLALQGGAKEVLVYGAEKLEISPDQEGEDEDETLTGVDFAAVRDVFESRDFNVFTWGAPVGEEVDVDTAKWVEQNGKDKKHFLYVTGGTTEEDGDEDLSNSRSQLLAQDEVINVTKGGTLGTREYCSGQFTPYMAGLIAGTPINESITYVPVALADVNFRMKNKEVEEALEAGSLVLVHDGDRVKVEQGITTSGDKIRKVASRQAIATDIERTARNSWIGRITNSEAGQATILSGIKTYLETLEAAEVLTDIVVQKSTRFRSEDDKFFVDIWYTELDSMERIFLTISPE